MEKETSAEVTMLGIWMIMVLFALFFMGLSFARDFGLLKLWAFPIVIYIISAYGILKGKKWARILALYFSILIVIVCIYALISIYIPYKPEVRGWAFLGWIAYIPLLLIGISVIFFCLLFS